MRELKIFAIVAFFSLLTYYLVEPFAHHAMHMKVDAEGNEIVLESHDFTYDGKDDIAEATRKGDKALIEKKTAFWKDVVEVSKIKGNAGAGEAVFANCVGCHNGMNMNMGGVIPPNLDHAGAIYDKNYLIALIKDPAMASNVDHKYADTSTHPMGSIKYTVSDNQQIADVVAYMLEKKVGEVTPKEVFVEACSRCHAMRYDKATQLGDTPKFKYEKDELAHRIKVIEEQDLVKAYMGNLPPDLSMMIRARGTHYMETFVANPQGQLAGTSMPRVGLNAEAYDKVKEHMTNVGDPSKVKREELGPYVLAFLFFFTLLAFFWKKSMWKDVH